MTLRAVGVHGVVTAGLTALVVLGGPVAPLCASALTVGLVADALRPRLADVPWTPVLAAALAGVAAYASLGGLPVDAVRLGLVALVLHRRIGGTGPRDDRIAVLVSALMLVVAGSRTASPLFVVCLVWWAFSAPLALLPSSTDAPAFGRSRPATRLVAGLSLAILVISGALYPLLPRASRDAPDPGLSRTGFAADVTLGDFTALVDDPGEVLRYRITPAPAMPVYLRGLALDAFDGRRWQASGDVAALAASPWPVPADGQHVLEVSLGDARDGVLFAAGTVVAVDPPQGHRAGEDRHGSLRFDGVPGPLAYRLLVEGPLDPTAGGVRPEADAPSWRYLRLPDDLDPRLDDLAREVLGAGPVGARIDRLEAFLRDGFAYTRVWSDGTEPEPLERFLLETRAGHCEYFASAAAVLLRAEGVPARVVSGFVGGDPDPLTGEWVVRHQHAHTWVEVWDGEGWRTVDPTPGPGLPSPLAPPGWDPASAADAIWQTAVLDFDGTEQRAALAALGRRASVLVPAVDPWVVGAALVGVLVLLIGAMGVPLARRWLAVAAGEARPEPIGPIARHHRRARRVVDAALGVPGALPPVAAAEWVTARAPDAGAPLTELAWLYYRTQLGGASPSPHADRARALADAVVQAVQARATASS